MRVGSFPHVPTPSTNKGKEKGALWPFSTSVGTQEEQKIPGHRGPSHTNLPAMVQDTLHDRQNSWSWLGNWHRGL